jgi:hypothetical protein
MLSNIMSSHAGVNLISIVLGLGFATFFRKVCKDGRCVVINGPNITEIKNAVYKIDNTCYKYTPVVTACKRRSTV